MTTTNAPSLKFRVTPGESRFPVAVHKTALGSYVIHERDADYLVRFNPVLPADLSRIEDSYKLGAFATLPEVWAAMESNETKRRAAA